MDAHQSERILPGLYTELPQAEAREESTLPNVCPLYKMDELLFDRRSDERPAAQN